MKTEETDIVKTIAGTVAVLLVLLALCLKFVFDMETEKVLTIIGFTIGGLVALVGLVLALGAALIIGVIVFGAIIVVWKAITVAPRVTSFIGTFIVVWYFSGYFYTSVGTGIRLVVYTGISEFMLSVYTGVGAGMLAALLCHMVIKAIKRSADKRDQERVQEAQKRYQEEQKNRVVVFLEHCCSHAKKYDEYLQTVENHLDQKEALPFWEKLEECGDWLVFKPVPGLNDWGAYASYEGLSNKLKIRINKLYNRAKADNQFAIIHQQRETNALLREVVDHLKGLVADTRAIMNNTAAAAASLASIDEHVGNMGKVLSAIESHTAATASNTADTKRTSAKAASGISDLKAIADQQVDATRAQGRGDNLKI